MNKSEDRERGMEALLRQRRVDARAADACPEAGVLAAWTDGGLHETESASVETHVSDCARCQAILAALVTPIPEAASAAPVSLWRRWQLGWLVPLTAAAAAVVLWVVVPQDAIAPLDQPARVNEEPAAIVAERPRQDQAQPSIQPQSTQPQPQTGAAPEPQRSALADAAPPAQELRREAAPPAAPPPPPASPAAAPAPQQAPVSAAPPPPPAAVDVQSAARIDRATAGGGAGGRGGAPGFSSAVGTVAESVMVSVLSPDPAIRWRLRGGAIDLSTNAGATWDPLQSGVIETLTAGSSPSPSICWVVGRVGAVIVTTDMRTWRRVAFPEPIDLTAVQAVDAQNVIVTAIDGRRWRTTDGGASWSTLQDF